MPLLTLILLLALNAWFVAAEFAMVSARRDQIEPDAVSGSTSAKYALRGIENVSASLAATQLGITACSLLIGAVGEPAIAHFFEPYMTALGLPAGTAHVVALVLALLIVTFLHMVVGEMVPKNIAIAAPSPTAKFVAIPLHVIVRLLNPVIWAMNTTSNIVVRKVLRATPKDEVDSSFTASQVQDFVAESVRQGLLDVDVLAGRHRIGCDDRVRVVGRGHHHGVCRLEHFVEHLAVVVVLLGSRVALEHVVGIFPVDVA